MIEPILIVLGIGALGGVVRSVLGYKTQSDENESFNLAKFGRSILRASIVGASVVMGATALIGGEITTQTYVLAFFTAVGADVLTKETAGATIYSKK